MTGLQFDDLLAKVIVAIPKKDTAMREALSQDTRIKREITQRYLAPGDSFKKTLEAIYDVLHEYIKITSCHNRNVSIALN
ncbi:hypothetical protein QE152_g17123 [Popillia japonica]|uniref:Uncharacterized protein n=1 Tax=Popillia japonica TaxID=7064 RepID=A0AAW1L557_POPJA